MTVNNENNLESMTRSALDHMIFPIVSRQQIAEEGPTIFARGEGCRLWTEDGREFLDMLGSPTRANSLGYANQEIAQAVYDQLLKVQLCWHRGEHDGSSNSARRKVVHAITW
jgi:adenosylmethionine-8-amino-7-oxononanoate aminotransferase